MAPTLPGAGARARLGVPTHPSEYPDEWENERRARLAPVSGAVHGADR